MEGNIAVILALASPFALVVVRLVGWFPLKSLRCRICFEMKSYLVLGAGSLLFGSGSRLAPFSSVVCQPLMP